MKAAEIWVYFYTKYLFKKNTMKIWIDLRFLQTDNQYSRFIQHLVTQLIHTDSKNQYTLYLHPDTWFPTSKVTADYIYTSITPGSIAEQTRFGKILQQGEYQLMLFFTHHKPISYKKHYFVLMSSLKHIFYQDFSSAFKKHIYMFQISQTIQHADRILVFDQISQEELSERFNIAEEKISLLQAGFIRQDRLDDISLDLGVTWWIKNPYLIYPGWGGIEKNLERLADSFAKLSAQSRPALDLVILWDGASSHIGFRNKIIAHNLQKKVFFISWVEKRQQHLLYTQSLWVIYPSLYETFSFELSNALHLNIPILCSNLPSLTKILWESASYFSPISVSDMLLKTSHFLEDTHDINYEGILWNYSIENSAQQLIKIIQK